MNQSTQRLIFRWIHITFSIPIVGYIYSPFEKLPDYAFATRFVFLPVMVLTGVWMWKGQCLSAAYFEAIGLTRWLQRTFYSSADSVGESRTQRSDDCELCDE